MLLLLVVPTNKKKGQGNLFVQSVRVVPALLPAAGIPTFQFEIGIPRKTPFKGEL